MPLHRRGASWATSGARLPFARFVFVYPVSDGDDDTGRDPLRNRIDPDSFFFSFSFFLPSFFLPSFSSFSTEFSSLSCVPDAAISCECRLRFFFSFFFWLLLAFYRVLLVFTKK